MTQKLNGKLSKNRFHITHKQNAAYTTLKQNVGNCCIQRTEPIKQKKRNHIKMLTPVEAHTS